VTHGRSVLVVGNVLADRLSRKSVTSEVVSAGRSRLGRCAAQSSDVSLA